MGRGAAAPRRLPEDVTATVRFGESEATVRDGVWTADNPALVDALTLLCHRRRRRLFEADVDLMDALYAAEGLGGEVTHHERPSRESVPEA